MKRFLIDTSVLNAEGSQTWFVDAPTEEEALAKFKAGGANLYESNVDVTSLDEPEISGAVPLDDFGYFAPEEALTCSVCGVETQNPWHFSTPTSRHEHACDKCGPTARPVWVDVAIRGDMARAVFDAIRVAVPGLGPWHAFDALEVQRMADALKPYVPFTPTAAPVQPVAQWQKKHATKTNDKWENSNHGDANWWLENDPGWEIRALYAAAPKKGGAA